MASLGSPAPLTPLDPIAGDGDGAADSVTAKEEGEQAQPSYEKTIETRGEYNYSVKTVQC